MVTSDLDLSGPAKRILLVLGQTPYPVELLDDQGRVIYLNLAYARSFLKTGVSILDLPSPVFPEVLPDGRPRQAVLQEARSTGLWKGEVKVTVAGGRQVPHRLQVFPIHHPGEGLLEYAVFYEDIEVEVREHEELIHQQNLLAIRSRQAQMGELLSMIAHQWRQPLTVIMSLVGNLQLRAQMGEVAPDYLQVKLEKMAATVQFLSETIDSFRNFYAPGKFQSDEDMAFLVRRALELMGPSLQKLGVKVTLDLPEVPVHLRLYPGEFLQVVLELITNARDALASGTAEFHDLRLRVAREGEWAIFEVANTGPPIPPEVLPRIYDPYYTTKEGAAGSGLGLYMTKLIVENHHHGTLTATSEGGWTRFVCTFPLGGLP